MLSRTSQAWAACVTNGTAPPPRPRRARRDAMFNGYWKHAAIGLTEEPAGKEPQVGRSAEGALRSPPPAAC